MHWEAFFVIGGLSLALGAVLLIPALVWARRARRNPEMPGARKVAKVELATTIVVVAIMFAPLTARFWAEDTWFGQWVSTDAGALTFLAAVFVAMLLLQLLTRAMKINSPGYRDPYGERSKSE